MVRYRFMAANAEIIKRANEAGEGPLELSKRFSEEFLRDMAELQCLPPTDEPRVTDHIEQIIDLITKIIDNGCGYTSEGDVYFSVENFPDYCCLSRRKLDANRAGGGGRVTDAEIKKKNDANFALWKSAKAGEPSWESPWGRGRPGWHIECSAMSFHYLGHSFDTHGGGLDLIFPHHENEIAQSRAAYTEGKVNFWMHTGFVNKDNQKMSKSDNNFFTIRDIIATYHPLALRFFLMRTHYRSDINYSDRALETASDRVFYIYQGKQQQLKMFRDLIAYEKEAKDVLGFLGLLSSSTCFELKEKALKRAGLTKEQVQEKIEERTLARKNKEFKKSDLIRRAVCKGHCHNG